MLTVIAVSFFLRKEPTMKPFIKWVGSKRQLVNQLTTLLPNDFARYYEPFLGSGALYFHLELDIPCYLGDINAQLMNTYVQIRKNPEAVENICKKFSNNPKFHKALSHMDRDLEKFNNYSNIFKAARFMYLNRTSYAGMWRVNSLNQFNTPYVKNTNNIFPDETFDCSKLLKSNSFLCFNQYQKTLEGANKHDFVYLDPPYHPISKTSKFTGYAKYEYDFQTKLASFCSELSARGVKFMLSNSHCYEILQLYSHYNIHIVEVNRPINSNVSKRGKIKEVVITNY